MQTFPNDIPTPLSRDSAQALTGPLRLASVGVLEERKNQALLLDCLTIFSAEEVQLHIWGDGPMSAALHRKARALGLFDRLRFEGWCNDPSRLWGSSDALLFPSLHEGAPNAVLEALGYNIPVLVSDIPEHREVVGDFGTVANDIESWCKAIRTHLLDECQRAQLRDRQERESLHLRFNWDLRITEIVVAPPFVHSNAEHDSC